MIRRRSGLGPDAPVALRLRREFPVQSAEWRDVIAPASFFAEPRPPISKGEDAVDRQAAGFG
jgi:hypothetical protein